jgi:phosphate transport system substrate-binding protein
MNRGFLFIFFVGILFGCSPAREQNEKGTAVSGTFTVFSDEAFKPVIETLAAAYMAQYPSVQIKTVYGPGSGNIKMMSSGKYDSYITSLILNSEDSAALSKREIYYKAFHFATDAVVIIRNKQNNDSLLNISESNKSLCITAEPVGNNVICTDNIYTDNTNTILLKIPYTAGCINKWFACGNNSGVVGYIEKNTNATGFMSYSFICDSDDPEMMKLKNRINVVKVGTDTTGYFQPTQTSLSNGTYPLTRKINLVTTEQYAGPATGFAAYVASQEGQQVIRLLGIVPAKMPSREIIINQ